jgi:uncharacterized protein involved in response to NO
MAQPASTPTTSPESAIRPAGPALLALGFRPFYMLAALLAALAVPAWVLQYLGVIPVSGPIAGMPWHMHEMVFGFAVAVITGFVFTAGRNWTGQPTPTGAWLAALAGLWVAARVLLVTGPALPAAIVDVAFLPLVAWSLWKALAAANNRRNYFFVALLLVLAALNVVFHLGIFGIVAVSPLWPVKAALYVVVVIVAVMGGRVIPMFTQNAVPKAKVHRSVQVDRWSIALLAAALTADALSFPVALVGLAAAAAAAAHLARLVQWDPGATLRTPILWILHASYAWIPIGLALLAVSAFSPRVHEVYVLHAFGIGAVGGMIMGMMTRTARGHTGRPLVASLPEVFAYGLVQAAALVRVALGLAAPALYAATLLLAALFWTVAFALYLVVYVPILTRTRLDGKPG